MARHELTDKVVILEDVSSCLLQADVVVITTPDPEFQDLQPSDFLNRTPPVVVYDCWRILREKLEPASHIRYIPLGIGIDDEVNGTRLLALWANDQTNE
jgi:hypothetical protein